MQAPQQPLRAAKEKVQEAAGGPARLQIVLVLAGVYGLDAADKATMSAVAGSLKGAFGIGNTDIGILIAAVSFVGAAFTLPVGVLVDRMSRRLILMVAISLWSVAMVVSGTATSFLYLLITRLFLGAVTAAAAPAVASLTGDFFPPNERASIYGMILAGELAGTGVGFIVAGEISSWLNWRWPFYFMAIPGAALIWAIWRYLPEPARGGQSWIELKQREVRSAEDVGQTKTKASQQETSTNQPAQMQEAALQAGFQPRESLILRQDPTRRSLWWAIGYMLRIPTYVLLMIASSLVYYFFSGLRAFAMIYFPQHYGVSHGAFSALVIVVGAGAILGVIFGGRLSEWLFRTGWLTARVILPGIALFVSVLFFAPAIVTKGLALGITLLTLGAAALSAANPAIDAARLDIIHPGLWGRAESGRMALRGALEGCAPILFGLISDWLGGGENGLMWTYLLMLIPVLIAASFAIPLHFTYPRDVATAGASVRTLRAGSKES